MSARTTVRIDDNLMARIRRLTPRRSPSRFVNEVLANHLASLEREQPERERLEQEMREGYLATRKHREELSREWGD